MWKLSVALLFGIAAARPTSVAAQHAPIPRTNSWVVIAVGEDETALVNAGKLMPLALANEFDVWFQHLYHSNESYSAMIEHVSIDCRMPGSSSYAKYWFSKSGELVSSKIDQAAAVPMRRAAPGSFLERMISEACQRGQRKR
jgi:hypothetical protein